MVGWFQRMQKQVNVVRGVVFLFIEHHVSNGVRCALQFYSVFFGSQFLQFSNISETKSLSGASGNTGGLIAMGTAIQAEIALLHLAVLAELWRAIGAGLLATAATYTLVFIHHDNAIFGTL